MGKIKEYDNAFKANYHGILTHDGIIQVAGYNAKGIIKNISKNKVLIKGHKPKSYVANVHKDLRKEMWTVTAGDTGFIKFRKGEAWLVGFQKKTYDKTENQPAGDAPVTSKTNWLNFFRVMEME
ncbi:hypothetical protein [Methanobrevibacter sp.]